MGNRSRAVVSPRSSAAILLTAVLVFATTPLATAGEPPAMPPPSVELALGGKLKAATIPVRVSWPAAPASATAVSHYTLQRDDGAGWTAVTLPGPLAREAIVRVSPWRSHAFRVQATYDDASSTAWGEAQPLWLGGVDEADLAIDYLGSWKLRADRKAYGGARVSSIEAGSSATYTFTAASVAWISMRGPKLGRARVYLDGTQVATVDLRRSRKQPRRVVFSATFDTLAERTLRIEVEGTAGRPRVVVDGFVTLAPPASATLIGAGDIGRCGSEAVAQTAGLITALDDGYTVYTTGDNAYPSGTAQDFANCYDPFWGAFKDVTRPSPGNHDNVYGLSAYLDYFGRNAGDSDRGWYRYNAGTWRVYSLNSEACRRVNGWCAPGSAQYDWLRADLLAAPHECVLAYWHRPRWSSGSHGGSTRMAAITGLLYDMGADVVAAGHDHGYERFEPLSASGAVDAATGIRHFVIGTGGAALYAYTKPPLASTVVRQADVHGVLRFDLHPGGYDWEFVPTQPELWSDGDSGSASCH